MGEDPGLVGLIYDSVADASRWSVFLDRFAQTIRAHRCALLIHDSEGDGFGVVRWHGWPDADIQLYTERYGAIDPLRAGSTSLPEGFVGEDTTACSREVMEASSAFREFYQPRDCIYGVGGIILVTSAGSSVISALRGAAAGAFGEGEKAVLSALMPHLKRAALLHGEIGSLRRQLSTFTGHIERYPYGFLLTAPDRRVLYSNAAAREIVASRDGLANDNGRLLAMSPRSEAAFAKAAVDVAGPGGALRRLEVPRPSGRKPFRLVLMPVNDSKTVPLGVAIPALSVLIIDSESLSEPDPDVLRELFSLTPAEARVSAKLVMGHNSEEIASESGTSIETVRTHIKRTLSKTGASRQSELVSLILRSVPFRRA